MTTENLFEAIGGIHDELLEQTEHAKKAAWKIWVPIAACLGAAILAVAIFLWLPNENSETILPPPANGNWTLNFSTETPSIQAQVLALPVQFLDKMESTEIEAILPTNRPDWLTVTGRGEFGKDKEPLRVYLRLETTNRYALVNLWITVKPVYPDLIFETGTSECNGVTFYSCEYKISGGRVRLETRAKINGYYFHFWTDIRPDIVERVKVDYKQILESFTYYAEPDKPQWSSVTLGKELESYEKAISFEKARGDADFGAYLPVTVPKDWTEISAIRHNKDYGVDNLVLRWTTGDGSVEWAVTWYDPEANYLKMTSALDSYRNLDQIGLIYQAEDLLPGNFDNSFLSGSYGVVFGDLLITVKHEKVLVGEWFWEQLVALHIVEADNIQESKTAYTYDEFVADNDLQDSPLVLHIPRSNDFTVFYKLYRSETREILELEYWKRLEKKSDITLRITHYDGQQLTDVADKEKYDLSEYLTPWDSYIPEQYRQQMERPIFNIEDLTADVLNARIYYAENYLTEPRMEFGIRIGDVVIYVFASNMTAEEVLEIVELM